MITGLWPRVDRRGGEGVAEEASIGEISVAASGIFARTSSRAARSWDGVAVSMDCLSCSSCEVSEAESAVGSIAMFVDSAIFLSFFLCFCKESEEFFLSRFEVGIC